MSFILEAVNSKRKADTAQGHVFAGATLPFGLAKAVADSVNDNAGGYASDGGPSKSFYQAERRVARVEATNEGYQLTMMLSYRIFSYA